MDKDTAIGMLEAAGLPIKSADRDGTRILVATGAPWVATGNPGCVWTFVLATDPTIANADGGAGFMGAE